MKVPYVFQKRLGKVVGEGLQIGSKKVSVTEPPSGLENVAE